MKECFIPFILPTVIPAFGKMQRSSALNVSPTDAKTPPFSYIPFGGGPRACIGAAFGQSEARVVIARLLQTYKFEFTNHKIHVHMGATLEPGRE